MIIELQWQMLAEGHRVARLMMFYKIHCRYVVISIPLSLKCYVQVVVVIVLKTLNAGHRPLCSFLTQYQLFIIISFNYCSLKLI